MFPPPFPMLGVFANLLEIVSPATWASGSTCCGLVNSVHLQYYLQCFQFGNKLNSVAHSIYHIWCTGSYIPEDVSIEY